MVTRVGGDEPEVLIGTATDDILRGMGGDDTLVGLGGTNLLDGGAGHDTADYSWALVGITARLHVDRRQATGVSIDQFLRVENLVGTGFADRLEGTAGNGDLANGLYAGARNVIDAGGGDDQVFGFGGADLLDGGAGNDVILGGRGRDTLIGGAGRDILRGGADPDVFRFDSITDSAVGRTRDRIDDFAAPGSQDIVDLSRIDADGDATNGDDAFVFIGGAAFSGTAGELRTYLSRGQTILAADVDGDGVADMEIAFAGAPTLTAADFVL